MANPFHDAEGKFCSRDGMLKSIHELAAAGRVSDYLKLKDEFDELDKDNVVIPKAELEELLQKKQPTPVNYATLDPSTLSGMIVDLDEKSAAKFAEGESDLKGEIRNILEASNYHDETMYEVVVGDSFTYDEKAELVLTHNQSSFYALAERYPSEVMSRHKKEFFHYLEALKKKSASDDQSNFALDRSASVIAKNATSTKEIAFAAEIVPYSMSYGNSAKNLAESKFIDKATSIQLLEKTLDSSTRTQYKSARWALQRGLEERGITIPEMTGSANPSPLSGSIPPKLLQKLTVKQLASDADSFTLDDVQSRVDAHKPNYETLKKELKQAAKEANSFSPKASFAGTKRKLRLDRRINAAHEYLNCVDDLSKLKEALADKTF